MRRRRIAVVAVQCCNVAKPAQVVVAAPGTRRTGVSLKDVAALAGVSVRTVSNVVNRFSQVAIENVAAAAQATAHLLALGRRRIAAIGVQQHLTNETARLRLEGYRTSLRSAGLALDERYEVQVAALHRSDGAGAMRHLLSL